MAGVAVGVITAGIITAIVGAAVGTTAGIVGASKENQRAIMSAADARKQEKRLALLEKNRQAVVDQSEAIRALKGEVYNPYAQLGVAMNAANIQMEETDESLANILDSINKGNMGAGNATALAKMAAASKAQVAAGIETQEATNQKLRIEGEAGVMNKKMELEQMALAEEVAAWGRQEERDLAKMDRLAGLADRSKMMEMAHQQAAQANMMSAASSITQAGTGLVSAGMSMPGKE